jgi:hypothetical protein
VHRDARLHYVRDVAYDEDRSQVRTGSAPAVMAAIRNIAITVLRLRGWANIAEAARRHSRELPTGREPPTHQLKSDFDEALRRAATR